MTELGVFGWAAGLMQLTVPSYALRLVRRFGSQQVGWFIALAFVFLALLHLIAPFQPYSFGLTGDLIYTFASVLLLVGMGHLETVLFQRTHIQQQEKEIQNRMDQEVQERTAALLQTRQRLLEELARHEQAEKALLASEKQYRLLFAQNPCPIWIYDPASFRLLAANEAAQRQLGLPGKELVSLDMRTLLAKESLQAFQLANALPCDRIHCLGILRFQTRDQRTLALELLARDVPYLDHAARLVVAQDTSGQRPRDSRTQQNLPAVWLSEMAEGIARPLANAMVRIEEDARLLLSSPQQPETAVPLNQIAEAAASAADLARQLLAAGCRHPLHQETLNLKGLLLEWDHTLRELVGPNILIQHSGGLRLPPVLGDARLLKRLVLNLVLNARDALPSGGRILLSTESVFLPEPQGNSLGRPGTFVCLTIADNGSGISPDTQARLFEPFFSTRRSEGRAGLGLTAAQGIARQHLGWVECFSTAGEGTQFKVYLPPAPHSALSAADTHTPIGETLLLIHPEGRPRALVRFALERNGYHVVEADTPGVALLLWQNQAAHIDLVLVALTIEKTAPAEGLAAPLRRTRPDVPIVFLNDMPAGVTPSLPRLEPADRYAPTPLDLEALVKSVEELLVPIRQQQRT